MLTLGTVAAGVGMLGAGSGIATLRLHRAPRKHPKLAVDHLADIRAQAQTLSDECVKILFVGNSNTLRHDIPALVAARATAADWSLWIATAAADGARLVETVRLRAFRTTLKSVNWDALVLQDFSRTPLSARDRVGSALAIRHMASLAPQARVILFPNWPDATGHPIYARGRKLSGAAPDDPQQFADRIQRFYQSVADDRNFTVAPVVPLWMAASAKGEPLYAADLHHASAQGAALVAQALFCSLRDAFGLNCNET